jgi:DNA-directed RNA polymerase subunit RPC12/RpoP
MMRNNSRSYHSLLREGILAAQVGNKNLAWSLLNQAAQMNPMDGTPWLWLTETTDDLQEKQGYLENALAADPNNPAARRGLAKLRGEASVEQENFSPDALEQARPSEEPVPAKAREVFNCPQCGGNLAFDIQNNKLTCQHCGYATITEAYPAADQERVMWEVLPTEKGHRWALSQQQMACEQCGAQSLWPPGQSAAACPYCGSHQLIESHETSDLVDPQALGIMQIDEKEATRRVVAWLGKGWTVPDDLKKSASKTRLRPAYFPFWTFDGTLEIHWSCEVNEGSGDYAQWMARSGSEFELFDDVLVPGLQSLTFKELNNLGKFNLKDVVAFKPDYLAGWPALTYDRSLAKATLLAREQVVQGVRRNLHSRVMPGRQKRDLETGSVKWQDMTFKYVLLPVWSGHYRYQGQDYRVLVNGQSGQVTGRKPRDQFKLVGLVLSIMVTIIVLGLVGVILASILGWI